MIACWGEVALTMESSQTKSSLGTSPGAMRMLGPLLQPIKRYPPWSKAKRSPPKMARKLLQPLSDHLVSWLPGTMYKGLLSWLRIFLACRSSASEPNSVTSPEWITKAMSSWALMSRTVRSRSSAAVAPPPMCVSEIWANLKGWAWAKAGSKMAKNTKKCRNRFITGYFYATF